MRLREYDIHLGNQSGVNKSLEQREHFLPKGYSNSIGGFGHTIVYGREEGTP